MYCTGVSRLHTTMISYQCYGVHNECGIPEIIEEISAISSEKKM